MAQCLALDCHRTAETHRGSGRSLEPERYRKRRASAAASDYPFAATPVVAAPFALVRAWRANHR